MITSCDLAQSFNLRLGPFLVSFASFMTVLYVAEKSFEIVLVLCRALMLFSLEGCVFDERGTMFAPVFWLRTQRVSYQQSMAIGICMTQAAAPTVDFQYSDMSLSGSQQTLMSENLRYVIIWLRKMALE